MAETGQLELFASLTRWEIPAGRWSWRDGSAIIKVTVGAHCVDLAWPWWKEAMDSVGVKDLTPLLLARRGSSARAAPKVALDA